MAPPDDPSPHTTTEEEDWQQLGDVPFRKWTCYPSLPWGLALDDHLVVGAANGGPLAVLRDDKRAVATTERLGGFLRIYSSAGVLLGQVPWELGRKVVEFGWTDAEELVVVLETGVVHWYTLLGHKVEESNKTTRLFADGSPRRVINAAVWGGGYVALADDYTLHVYDGTKTNPDARLFCLAATGLSGQRSPTSMALLQPSSYYASSSTAGEEESSSSSSSGGGPSTPLQILLGTSDNCLLVLESERGTAEVYNLNDTLPSPVTKMAASPDGRFLGCFAEGLLSVYTTSTFSKVLDPFDAGTSHPPLAMGWCGKDALVLYWRVMGLLLVGPYGDFLHFPYSEPLALVPEVDCCRVLTTGACEMLQRVPPSTEAIHRIGSTEPAAMLFDAMEAFEKGDPKADENIRSIINSDPTSSSSFSSSSAAVAKSNQLHGAVQACLRAALAAWDVGRQKKYLQAASYGKGFYDDEQRHQHHALLLDEDGEEEGGGGGGGGSGKEEEEEAGADEFVTVCRKLRVLNQLRRPAIGLPLTAQQLEKGGGWALLIDRLVLRRHYFLALKVCDYLRLQQEKERVLIHWACAYLQSRQALAQSDEEIREEIRRKVDSAFSSSSSSSSSTPSISYAAIARTADKVRRRGLATMLLAYEPSATQHVELLLEMREFELALSRALASNDLDLSYRALLHIEAHKPSQEAFLRLLSTHPSALSLLRIYYRHKLTKEDRTPWFNLSLARGDFVEAGTILAFQAYAQESLPRRIEMLKEAARLYGHQGKQPSSSSSSSASASAATAAASAAAAAFYNKATEEQAELLEVQQELEKRTGKNESVFVDMSVSETIYNLIVLASDVPPPKALDFLQDATRLQKRFKVPDKRYWYIKIKALAASGQWEMLKQFSNEKKSPVGYKAFAQACITHKQPSGAVEAYIDRITALEDKFDLYVEVKLWQKAAETAFRLKDPLRLRQVQANCLLPGLQRSIDDLLAKL